jgi:hypothetical protein
VGDIISVDAQFDNDFGTFISAVDDTYYQYTLPFAFPYYGVTQTTAYVGTNGYITFGSGDSTYTEDVPQFTSLPRIAAFFDDLYGRQTGRGLFVKSLPDRFVVTYNQTQHYSFGGSNTLQIILFPNGTIQFGYRGITALQTGSITGITKGPGFNSQQVDYSNNTFFTAPPNTAVYEYFTGQNPFDLDNSFVIYSPSAGGYAVRTVLAPPGALAAEATGGPGDSGVAAALAVTNDLEVIDPATSIAVRREKSSLNTAAVSPLANAEVEIRSSGQTDFRFHCNTDANGGFSLRGLAPGGIEVRITRRGQLLAVGGGVIPNRPGATPSVAIRLVSPARK